MMKTIYAILLCILHLPVFGQNFSLKADLWFSDGQVNCIVEDYDSSRVFIGGEFNNVGPFSPNGIALDSVNAQPQFNCPPPNGEVLVSIPDGKGGWYIGGEFTEIGGVQRLHIAQIDSTCQVTSWNPSANNTVRTLFLLDSILFVGGDFQAIGGQSKNYLGVVYTATGLATSWNATFNNPVHAILVSNQVVYVGGTFTSINSYPRSKIGALNLNTALVTSWNPSASSYGHVGLLDEDNTHIYAGGDFSFMGSLPRGGLAKINKTTGAIDAWNPAPSGTYVQIKAMVVKGNLVYVGGLFSYLADTSCTNIVAINKNTGISNGWLPNASYDVRSILVENGKVYVGQSTFNISNLPILGLAVYDSVSGLLDPWYTRFMGGHINTISRSAGKFYVGGYFSSAAAIQRKKLAALDMTTGEPTNFNLDVSGYIRDMTLGDSSLFISGDFAFVGDSTRQGIAEISFTTNQSSNFKILQNNKVNEIAYRNDSLFLGGTFTTINGISQKYLALIRPSTNTMLPVVFGKNEPVLKIHLHKKHVYFLQKTGTSSHKISRGDLVSGLLDSWQIACNKEIRSWSFDDTTVFVGGYFTNISGAQRNRAAEISLKTSSAKSWNPNVSDVVESILVHRWNVYLAGGFNSVNNYPAQHFAEVNRFSGVPTNFNVNHVGDIKTFSFDFDRLYFGGFIYKVDGYSRTNLFGYDDCSKTRFDTLEACESYLGIDGVLYTESNSCLCFLYPDTTVNGCDSILQLNLTISEYPDSTVNKIKNFLIAKDTGASYQWYDCSTNLPVNGAIHRAFLPQLNGTYQVELKKNNCIVKSPCFQVTTLSLLDENIDNTISVYPNPSQGAFFISFASIGEYAVDVYSLSGSLIQSELVIIEKDFEEKRLDLTSGVFVLKIRNAKTQSVNYQKIVVL